MEVKKSPVLTIKRAGRQKNWQDFIDREQSSVDHLLKDSFATFCKEAAEKSESNANNMSFLTLGSSWRRNKSNSSSSGSGSSSSPEGSPSKFNKFGSRTLPRLHSTPKGGTTIAEDLDGLHLPPGIEELETLYAPMKNLSRPLPSASNYSEHTMPIPAPLMSNWNEISALKSAVKSLEDADAQSEICSVMADMPPPPAPVQSHAVLEKSLGHEIPLTPARTPKFSTSSNGSSGSSCSSFHPPPLPKRVSSKLTLKQQAQQQSSRPQHLNIYANSKTVMMNRSSLMSTGSSEESSGSSNSGEAIPMVTSPTSATSNKNNGEAVFAWPNYTVSHSQSPSPCGTDELRSVSQIGEPPDSASEANSSTHSSEAYVKMNRVFNNSTSSEATYMNVIYNAVQRQGGQGTVEEAMTPYIDLSTSRGSQKQPRISTPTSKDVRLLPNANVDSISSIYARPQSRSSTSSDVTLLRVKKAKKAAKTKALNDLKQLMAAVSRKRTFRVGLNLFNSRPEVGVEFLAARGFVDLSAESVAKFLHSNAGGLSLEKVGEYLGNLQSPFAMKVLSCFMQEFDFAGQRIDKSLRKLLHHVRVTGEAQKIEKVMEVFGKRYNECNPGFKAKLKSPDSIVTLAFGLMLLNTDLHSPNLKVDKKMTLEAFLANMKGVDDGKDFDSKLLKQVYKGIKKQEFVGGVDHVVQTQLLQRTILQDQSSNKTLSLAEGHRRLVCLCRLFEVMDVNSKKEPSPGSHQRDLFLFNDLLVITKQSSKSNKTNGTLYVQRESFGLSGVEVTLFHTPVYNYGIQISRKRDGEVLATLNAGSEHDRYKFVMDLQESIFEMDQMDQVAKEMAHWWNISVHIYYNSFAWLPYLSNELLELMNKSDLNKKFSSHLKPL